ncbi:MAG: hypothetical protein EA353_05300 [Puniceicoccaceae bacterium]|nr:MAG: hypothetical protein EA353_05300 [Puniceicoccaceae bacterium]
MTGQNQTVYSAVESLKQDWSFIEPLKLPTESIKDRSAVFIRDLSTNGSTDACYVKIYAYKKTPWQRIFRAGRSQIEARNLLFFRSLGIATPDVLAWGERRNKLGRLVEEFIITRAEPDTLQLDEFVTAHLAGPESSGQSTARLQVAGQLGEWTRRIHENHFIHEDLKWRNILARRASAGVELFWIDCPKGSFYKQGRQFERKKLKDCATLDKLARLHCSKDERRAFLESYLGEQASYENLTALCARIESYRRNRFDAKDDQQREHAKNTH